MVNMIKKIPFKRSVNTMMILVSLVIVYHLLIVSGMIPYDAIWGGRLESQAQMYSFEAVSITINLLILAVVAIKGAYLSVKVSDRLINIILWIFTAMFALNTAGNIFSLSTIEAVVFTPLTFLSAVMCARMAIEKK